MRKVGERSGEDLVRRDEKRMRRGADSGIKRERMKERKVITEGRCGRGRIPAVVGRRAETLKGERDDDNFKVDDDKMIN